MYRVHKTNLILKAPKRIQNSPSTTDHWQIARNVWHICDGIAAMIIDYKDDLVDAFPMGNQGLTT